MEIKLKRWEERESAVPRVHVCQSNCEACGGTPNPHPNPNSPPPPGGGTRPLGVSPCDESSVPIFLRYILLALFQRPLMKERFVTSDMAAEGGGATRTHVGSSAGRWAGW